MSLLVFLIILILLFGGGGWYAGPGPWQTGGYGLGGVLLLILVIMLVMGRL